MAQAKQTTPDTDALMKEVEALRKDFGALTQELKSLAQDSSESLSARAADRVVALKTKGERQLEEASALAGKAAEDASDYVKKKPATSMAGAAALGFVVGALTARR